MALAYEHSIELCRTRPAFERFASLSVAESVAGGAAGNEWWAVELWAVSSDWFGLAAECQL